MKPTVYIHTNDQQMIGAIIAKHSLKSRSAHPDKFDVKILRLEETPHLNKREGQEYLRKGKKAIWQNDDLQSFSPLRMMVPQDMGYKGRALLIDPDVFAIGDVWELLNRDMEGKSIWCRHMDQGYKGNGHKFFASSVMLLDCEKLTHWNWDEQVDQMFSMNFDYGPWIGLLTEPVETLGRLEDEWNHMDTLNEKTKLLHTTERSTQPWKTGLPVDFDTNWRKTKDRSLFNNPNESFLNRMLSLIRKPVDNIEYYQQHPDINQQNVVIDLIKESLSNNTISMDFLKSEIDRKHVRPDLIKILKESA